MKAPLESESRETYEDFMTTQTQAELFWNRPEIAESKQKLIQSLKQQQSALTQIRGPIESKKEDYDALTKNFGAQRGGSLFIPYLSSGLGNGPLVELADGSVKYDMIIGIGVHIMGHSHAGLTEALIDSAFADTVMQGNLQQDVMSTKVTNTILKAANKNGDHFKSCFLSTSGVMAGENALKMAFQKRAPAKRILCLKDCFMGRTLLMSNTTDNPKYREGLPPIIEVDYIPFFDHNKPEESIQQATQALKELLDKQADQYAAMSFELVLGEGGFYPGHHDYFVSLMSLLKQHGIPILADEVQSFSRTTEPFAFQHFGLDEFIDVAWIGKASQVCATVFKEHMTPKPGLLSQTYTGSSSAIYAGNYIINELMNGNYFGANGKNMKFHKLAVDHIKNLEKKYPGKITGPYGIGSMVAFTPFDGDETLVKKFVSKLYDNGVIGFTCGKKPLRVRFLLPIGSIEEHHLNDVFKIVDQTFNETLQ